MTGVETTLVVCNLISMAAGCVGIKRYIQDHNRYIQARYEFALIIGMYSFATYSCGKLGWVVGCVTSIGVVAIYLTLAAMTIIFIKRRYERRKALQKAAYEYSVHVANNRKTKETN